MNIRRAAFMAVLVLAVAALAVPLIGLRASASGSGARARSAEPRVNSAPTAAAASAIVPSKQKESLLANGQYSLPVTQAPDPALLGKISPETLSAMGMQRIANPAKAAAKIASKIKGGERPGGQFRIQTGEPVNLNGRSALSDALIFTEGGRDTQFSEVGLLADWDGREDCAADHSVKVDDFSFAESEPDVTLTRAAISEHTFANGFSTGANAANIFYYGDSAGNVWVGADTNGDGRVDSLLQIPLPSQLNAFGTINSDDQVTVTGIAVQPVADLGSFGNVNGSYQGAFGGGAPGTSGVTGEILYVTYTDSESGLRLTGSNTPVRSGLLAFPVSDAVSPATAAPGVISQLGFPVTVGGAFGVAFSVYSNIGGCAVDDDGSVYFQQVDLIQFTGANIVEVRSTDDTAWDDRSTATNGFPTLTTLNPTAGQYGTASGPVSPGVSQINTFTNYSGTSTLFGDIVAINTGPCNVLYAAVSPSFVAPGDATQGLFPAPSAYTSGTPSMIISFADCSGAFDICSGIASGSVTTNVGGTLPVANGIADKANNSVGTVVPGVNNFRIFALGNGPDIRPATGGTAIVPGTLASVLKIDMQIDYAGQSGIAVSQEGTVFVVSGGEPAGVGKSPSPMIGEILCFEDACPSDRRADFVDLRGNAFPNPPTSGGNVGDGDSDRFDHIFWQAPIDQVTLTPTGLAGLNFGFLRYTNRLAPAAMGAGVTLGVTDRVLGDDATTQASIIFENLDPGHQVAGGDDQNTPFRGDDDDGAGSPPVAGPLAGGFEFLFGGPVGTAACVWNGFFWNSNGNITFGAGDTDNTPTVPEFRAGLPRIAPAWADLNPAARSATLRSFPVMALGFVNVNAFKIRMINVPRFDEESCTGGTNGAPRSASNTFSLTLYDDGTSIDENANQPLNPANPIGNNAVPFDLQEGPTDLRFTQVNFTNPTGGSVLVGCPPRRDGSGIFVFGYCRMDLLGTADFPVIAGYSIGGLDPLNPPGLCETNLSVSAAAADAGAFGVLAGSQIAAVGCNCCIGEGTEPTIFELFNEGTQASTGSGGEITFAKPDFDLRFEGNDAATCTSTRQRDANRGRVCFLGIGCAPPANPSCGVVVPGTFVTTPTTTGLVNAICQVPLNIVGCGFFPNEVTTICQGFEAETGVPLQRPGKTVSTAATLACDTNGDGIAESVVVLTNVTPVSCNLVTATIPVTASLPGTGFPAACCGGPSTITVTTTFSEGDNNVFGPFTRTFTCPLALGGRAPVVFSATPSTQACNGLEDLLITGACFQFAGLGGANGTTPTTFSATSVYLQDKATGAIILPCAPFTIINNNLIDVNFCLTSAQAGHTYLVFVTNANGTSRNLTAPVTGQPGAPCPTTGNEAGIQVTFACNAPGTPGTGGTPVIANVTGCKLDRQDTGQFFLDVTGTNIKEGATATVGGVTPKKIKVVAVETGTSNPTTLRLVKKVCNGLPGNVVITNTVANGGPSQPFLCSEKCPTN